MFSIELGLISGMALPFEIEYMGDDGDESDIVQRCLIIDILMFRIALVQLRTS